MSSKEKTLKSNLDFVLKDLLTQFISNIQGNSACLLTEDGLTIAESNKLENEQYDNNNEFGAVIATMLSIAEQAVLHYKSSQNLSHFSIETLDLESPEQKGHIIFAYQIYPNVLFAYNSLVLFLMD